MWFTCSFSREIFQRYVVLPIIAYVIYITFVKTKTLFESLIQKQLYSYINPIHLESFLSQSYLVSLFDWFFCMYVTWYLDFLKVLLIIFSSNMVGIAESYRALNFEMENSLKLK